MASVLDAPAVSSIEFPCAAAAEKVVDCAVIGGSLRRHDVSVVAHGAVAVGLLNFAELQLKHNLFIGVGAGHLFLDFSF